ncbi:MAG: hypothetical protein QM762_12525 [Chryseolinea sp.]
MEKIQPYPLLKRIGYARRNNWFLKRKVFGIMILWMPTSVDIHIHNTWKDLKNKQQRNEQVQKR